ncbi:hypothetical protein LCGC14_2659210 [marine sediment metagenome]|uniref:Uncharacterized protein n=1 Tax=marine sediment metagenome TaxID=412755 RepID=A0A0F9CJC5_9ZZZZ
MGWGDCGTDEDGRPIGYYFDAACDEEGCEEEIDRGLAYACGGMHGFEEGGCDKYFCGKHMFIGGRVQMCTPCQDAHGKLTVSECYPGPSNISCTIHDDQQSEHEELDWDECNEEGCDFHDDQHAEECGGSQ